MNKICTNVEQSKKLMELGLNTYTADMCWLRYKVNDKWKEECTVIDGTLDEDDVYAWSLSALLELMPPYLFKFERGIDLNIYPDLNGKGWHCSYMANCIENMKTDKFKLVTSGDSLVDACYEMIIKLKKVNLL